MICFEKRKFLIIKNRQSSDFDFLNVKNVILSEKEAKDMITKKDKQRASYYNYYSNKKWGQASSYNLSVDSGVLGIDGTVEMLKNFIDAACK